MSSIESMQTATNEEEQVRLSAMQLATASVLPMILKSAIELDVLEIIAKAGEGRFLSAKEIMAQIPSKNPNAPKMLDRILRFLSNCSVLKCEVRETDMVIERFYGMTPVMKYLTRNEDGVSMADLLLLNQDMVTMEIWCRVKDAVLEGGIPSNKALGMSAFEYMSTDPRFNKIFNNAMSNHSTITIKKILDTYTGFEGFGTLVDVGGGIGATISMIISKHPSVKGINFDLPHVIQDAPTFPGMEHIGGNMFASVPKGDAISMMSICHNWSDEQCSKLLKNCYDALPENGKVIIIECILPVYPDTSIETKNIAYLDMIMLAHTEGGIERTEKEFEILAKRAGFTGFQVMCSCNNMSVMEFLKNA